MLNISKYTVAHPPSGGTPVVWQQRVKRCHIQLPDSPEPIGAIAHDDKYYSFVRFFSTIEAAERGAQRLIDKGNEVLITPTPKGFVLWVYEPEATRVTRR